MPEPQKAEQGLSSDRKRNIEVLTERVKKDAQFGHNDLYLLAKDLKSNPAKAKSFGFSTTDVNNLEKWSMAIRRENVSKFPSNIGSGGFLYATKDLAEKSKQRSKKKSEKQLSKIETMRFGPSGTETIGGQIGDIAENFLGGFTASERMAQAEQAGMPPSSVLPKGPRYELSPYAETAFGAGAGFSDTLAPHLSGLATGAIGGSTAANAINLGLNVLPQTRLLRGIGVAARAVGPLIGGFYGAGVGPKAIEPFTPLGQMSDTAAQEYQTFTQGAGRKIGETAAFLSTASPYSRDALGRPTMFSGGLRRAVGEITRNPLSVSRPDVYAPFVDIGNRAFIASHSIQSADQNNKTIRDNFVKTYGREPSREELESTPGFSTERDKLSTAASLALLGHFNVFGRAVTGHGISDIAEGLSAIRKPSIFKKPNVNIPSTQIRTNQPEIQFTSTGTEIPKEPTTGTGEFVGDPTMIRMDFRGKPAETGGVPEPNKTLFFNPKTRASRFGEKPGMRPDFVTKHNDFFASDKSVVRNNSGAEMRILGMSTDGEYFVGYSNAGEHAVEALPFKELPDLLKPVAEKARLASSVGNEIIAPEEIIGRNREYNPESDSNENYSESFKYKVRFAKFDPESKSKRSFVDVFAHVLSIKNKGKLATIELPSGNKLTVPIESVKHISGEPITEGPLERKMTTPGKYFYTDISGKSTFGNGLLLPYQEGYERPLMRGASISAPESLSKYLNRAASEFTLKPGTLVDLGLLKKAGSKESKVHLGVILGHGKVSINGESGYGYRIRMVTDPTTYEFMAAPEFISKATAEDIANAKQTPSVTISESVKTAENKSAETNKQFEENDRLVKDLQSQLNESIKKQEELSKNLSDIEAKFRDSETNRNLANDLLKESKIKLSQIENQISQKEQQISDLQSEMEGLNKRSKQYKDLKQQLDDLVAEKNSIDSEKNNLLSQINKLVDSVSQLEKDRDEIKAERDSLKGQSSASTSEIDSLKSDLEKMRQRQQELEEEARRNAEELEELRSRSETKGAGEGKPKFTQRDVAPSETEFPYGSEYKVPVSDEFLPEELKTANRGEKFRFYAQTAGDEFDRQGNISNIPSAFRTLFRKMAGVLNIDGVNVNFENVTNSDEFKLRLVKVWGQSQEQAEALSRWVDYNATGWAHEIARLSGVSTKLRVMALRTDAEAQRAAEVLAKKPIKSDTDAWKAIYREQVITKPTKETYELISKLKRHWYTERLGAIAELSPELAKKMGMDPRDSDGFTQSFSGNENVSVNIAFAMRSPKDYGTHVHEVGHLVTRAMYAPMYHELAASIHPALSAQNTTFSRAGQKEINFNGVTIKRGQLVEIPKFVEEQIVTSITRQMFESGLSEEYRPLAEKFGEGGAVHDSVLSKTFQDIGRLMRLASETPGASWKNKLGINKGWGIPVDRSTEYKKGTPILRSNSGTNSGTEQWYLNENARLDKSGKFNTVRIISEKGVEESVKFTDSNTSRVGSDEVPVFRVGQLEARIGKDKSEQFIIGTAPSKVLAKFLGHWVDHTNEMIDKYSFEYESKPIDVVLTASDLVRRTTGSQWWANAEQYNKRRIQQNRSALSDARISGRTYQSYLGWLDIGDVEGRSGYDAFIPYETILELEKRQSNLAKELNIEPVETDTNESFVGTDDVDPDTSTGADADDAADFFAGFNPAMISTIKAPENNNFNAVEKDLNDFALMQPSDYFEIGKDGKRKYETLIEDIIVGNEKSNDGYHRHTLRSKSWQFKFSVLRAIKENLQNDSDLQRQIRSGLFLRSSEEYSRIVKPRGMFAMEARLSYSDILVKGNEWTAYYIESARESLDWLFRNIIPAGKNENGDHLFFGSYVTQNGIESGYMTSRQLWSNVQSAISRSATETTSEIRRIVRGKKYIGNKYYSFFESISNDAGMQRIINSSGEKNFALGVGEKSDGTSYAISVDPESELYRRIAADSFWTKLTNQAKYNKDIQIFIDPLSIESPDSFGITKEAIEWFKNNSQDALSTKAIFDVPELRGIPAMWLFATKKMGIDYDSQNKKWRIANIGLGEFTTEVLDKIKTSVEKDAEINKASTLSIDELFDAGRDVYDAASERRPEQAIFKLKDSGEDVVVQSAIQGLENPDFIKSSVENVMEETRRGIIFGDDQSVKWPEVPNTFHSSEIENILNTYTEKSPKIESVKKTWSAFKSAVSEYVNTQIKAAKKVGDLVSSVIETETKEESTKTKKALVDLSNHIQSGKIDISGFDLTSDSAKPIVDFMMRNSGRLPSYENVGELRNKMNELKSKLSDEIQFDPEKIKDEIKGIDSELAKIHNERMGLRKDASAKTKADITKREGNLKERKFRLSQKINSAERWNETVSDLTKTVENFRENKGRQFIINANQEYDLVRKKLSQAERDIDAYSELVDNEKKSETKDEVKIKKYEMFLSQQKAEKKKLSDQLKALEQYRLSDSDFIERDELIRELNFKANGPEKTQLEKRLKAITDKIQKVHKLATEQYELTAGEKAEELELKRKIDEAQKNLATWAPDYKGKRIEHPSLISSRENTVASLKRDIETLQKRIGRSTELDTLSKVTNVDIDLLVNSRAKISNMMDASSKDAIMLLFRLRSEASVLRDGNQQISEKEFFSGLNTLSKSIVFKQNIAERAKAASEFNKDESFYKFQYGLSLDEASWLENYYWLRHSQRRLNPEGDFEPGSARKDRAMKLMARGDKSFNEISGRVLKKLNVFEGQRLESELDKLGKQKGNVQKVINLLSEYTSGNKMPQWFKSFESSHFMSDLEKAIWVMKTLDNEFLASIPYEKGTVGNNKRIADKDTAQKMADQIRNIFGIDVEDALSPYTQQHIKNIVTVLNRSVLIPIDFSYYVTQRKSPTVSSEKVFDRSSVIHSALKKIGVRNGVLGIVDPKKPLTYSELIKRLESSLPGENIDGMPLQGQAKGKALILSDTEIKKLIDLSVSENADTFNVYLGIARFMELTKSRDEYIAKPLSEILKADHDVLTSGISIQKLNEVISTDPRFIGMTPSDKVAMMGSLYRHISDSRNEVTNFIRLMGHIPTEADLRALAQATMKTMPELESQLNTVNNILSNISIEAFASGVSGSSIEMRSGIESENMSYVTFGNNVSPNSMFINESQHQDQILRQVDNLFDEEVKNLFVRRGEKPTREQLDTMIANLSSRRMSDILPGIMSGQVSPEYIKPGEKRVRLSAGTSPSKYTVPKEEEAYASAYRRHVKGILSRAIENVVNIIGSDQSGKSIFADTPIGKNIKGIANGSVLDNFNALKGITEQDKSAIIHALKMLASATSEGIVDQRLEIINSVKDRSLDSFIYTYDSNSGKVVVTDSANDNVVVYTIDYKNARVFDAENNIVTASKPVSYVEIGDQKYPVTKAQHNLIGLLMLGRKFQDAAKRNDFQKLVTEAVVLTSMHLKSVPAVYFHGINRVNALPSNETGKTVLRDPMFLSTIKSPNEIFSDAGSVDEFTKKNYVLPVIRGWKNRGRMMVNEQGMPFYDGKGYTVQDSRGFRSGIFERLVSQFGIDKSLEVYALTEHPFFRKWMAGTLIENPRMHNAGSYLDQKRVLNPEVYFKAQNGIRSIDAINAIDNFIKNPSDENFELFKFAFEQIKEVNRGFGDDYESFDKMFDSLKKDKDIVTRVAAYKPLVEAFLEKNFDNNTRPILNPYMDKVKAQQDIKTGEAFTTLGFDNLDNNMYSYSGNGIKSFDLGNGLYTNSNRNNTPRFIRFKNPFVHDAKNSSVDVFEFQKIMTNAIENGYDGVILTNVNDDMFSTTKKNLAFTLDDANILNLPDMVFPKTSGSKATINAIRPMFLSTIPANFTAKNIPAASGTKTVQKKLTTKDKLLKFGELVYDNAQDITRFSLSHDLAFTFIQGGKAMLGAITDPFNISNRRNDSWIALRSLWGSFYGMAPNLRIEIGTPSGKQIKIGWDKLGRRQYMQMYKSVSADPFFDVLRSSDAPLHFISLEKKVEQERMRRYHAAGGKVKYSDIHIDLMDFDEQGNLPDFYEQKTLLSHMPMRGMFERQMSLQHDLLLYSLLKNQAETNPIFNKMTHDQLKSDPTWRGFVKFLGLSQGDLRFSSNDIQDMQRGRIAKFFFQAPRWYAANILSNPIINIALAELYKRSPALRKKMGNDPKAIWYTPEMWNNPKLRNYIIHDTIGTMLTMALVPTVMQLIGQLFQREDINRKPGNLTGWRLGDWEWAETTGTWDFAQHSLKLWEAISGANYSDTGKYGMTPEELNKQNVSRVANVVLYKASPLLTRFVAGVSGEDFLDRPSWARNEAIRNSYIDNVNFLNQYLNAIHGDDIPELPFTSNFTTQFGLSWLQDHAEAYYKSSSRVETLDEARTIAINQLIASFMGLRGRYSPFISSYEKDVTGKIRYYEMLNRNIKPELDSFETFMKGQ